MKKQTRSLIMFIFTIFISKFSNAIFTQEQIDEIVGVKAEEIYHLINTNWAYPQIDEALYTESEFWKPMLVPPHATLKLKDPQYDIIKAFRELPIKSARLECMVAVKLVKILCLLELLGDDKFNEWLQVLPETTGRYPSDPLFFHVIPDRFFVLEGNTGFYYVTNHKAYTSIKPKGIGCGYNGFLFANQQFISFDPTHFEKSKSIENVQHLLFNDIMSDENVKNISLHTVLKNQYADNNGFINFRLNCLEEKQKLQPIWKFSADKINAFIEKSIIPKNG